MSTKKTKSAKTDDTGKVQQVALASLIPDPAQPRRSFDKAALKALAENIRARGVITPILARRDEKGNLIIVDGERRWRAAKLAKVKTVPVILVDTGAYDDTQIRLDQVAVNQLREPLKPMDMARLLRRFRDEDKLSHNEIASRLDKDGIPWQGKKHLDDLLQLTELPDWAQEMIDAGAMEPGSVKPILAAKQDAKVLKTVQADLRGDIKWRGKVTAAEVAGSVKNAYHDHATRLHTDIYRLEPALFDPAKACKGCEHRRHVGGEQFCMNRPHFDELQAQAKEAGLQPGGKKPRKESPAAAAKEDEQKAEKKAQSHQGRVVEYLDGWVRAHLKGSSIDVLRPYHDRLVTYLAAGMPQRARWAGPDEGERAVSCWSGPHPRSGDPQHQAARAIGWISLTEYLVGTLEARDTRTLAHAAVAMLDRPQLRELWTVLQLDMEGAYRIDADYLRLQVKATLLKLAELGGCEDYQKLPVGDLRERILSTPGARERIGAPEDVRAAWESKAFQPDDGPAPETETVCIGCGCTDSDGCPDGCGWMAQEALRGVCTNCPDHLERFKAGDRSLSDDAEDRWDEGELGASKEMEDDPELETQE